MGPEGGKGGGKLVQNATSGTHVACLPLSIIAHAVYMIDYLGGITVRGTEVRVAAVDMFQKFDGPLPPLFLGIAIPLPALYQWVQAGLQQQQREGGTSSSFEGGTQGMVQWPSQWMDRSFNRGI